VSCWASRTDGKISANKAMRSTSQMYYE
jgi:hypothetical protein